MIFYQNGTMWQLVKSGTYLQYIPKVSGLQFYYPFSSIGDEKFYEKISQNYKGYYSLWKWEHQKVFEYIKKEAKILEIGCGKGFFLEKLKEKQVEATGLDFNPNAITYGKQNNINIINETIEQHAINNENKYDVVCAFQLLEHINEANTFLEQTIKTLKKGGILAIGVPNNDSYIFRADSYHTLNTPPHHMLLWNRQSLVYLAEIFDMSVVEITTSPTTRLHKGVAYNLWLENKLGKNIFTKIFALATRWIVKSLSFLQQGTTIVAVYKKN